MQDQAPSFIGVGDFVYRGLLDSPVVAADGADLIDANGRHYLDATACNGAAMWGYDVSLIHKASAAISALPALPSFCESPLRLQLAERLHRMVLESTGLSGRVAFALGGAQGIELALKIVRANRAHGPLLVFEGGYHGRSPTTAHLSSSARYRRGFEDFAPAQITRLPSPNCAECRFGQSPERCAVQCASFVEATLTRDIGGLVGGPEPAALVFESLQNVAGLVAPDPRYLCAVVERLQHAGAIVIADEVFTGFHRTGPLFGFLRYGLKPDIIVMSKALTNGSAALSAIWARTPLADAGQFGPGSHSVTFGNVPWAMAVANESVSRFEDVELMRTLVAGAETGLESAMRTIADRCPEVADWSVIGATARMRLSTTRASSVQMAAARSPDSLSGRCGVLLAATGLATNVVGLHPALTLVDADYEAIARMVSAAINTVSRRGSE